MEIFLEKEDFDDGRGISEFWGIEGVSVVGEEVDDLNKSPG